MLISTQKKCTESWVGTESVRTYERNIYFFANSKTEDGSKLDKN